MAENKLRKVVFVSREDQEQLERLAELNGFSVSGMTAMAIKQGLEVLLFSNAPVIRT